MATRSVAVGIRITPALRARLMEAAAAGGCTLSREIERRLLASFDVHTEVHTPKPAGTSEVHNGADLAAQEMARLRGLFE